MAVWHKSVFPTGHTG
ncbi:hypothetical protein F383_21974 [Gossypium arboreum]|uniref:Uncharacterized protein n=1 Tax=Gossypium arboreum TaxID=29729 RepID=A0A0B0NTJ1_GOSAR|nr:hypothetical protein F383_21974 [Gossypium arboreum]